MNLILSKRNIAFNIHYFVNIYSIENSEYTKCLQFKTRDENRLILPAHEDKMINLQGFIYRSG